MGGIGSGRYGGQATVEGCSSLVLDVDEITRPFRRAMRKLGISKIPHGRVLEIPCAACVGRITGTLHRGRRSNTGLRCAPTVARLGCATTWATTATALGRKSIASQWRRRLARSVACAGGGYARQPAAGFASCISRTVGIRR